VQTGLNTIGGGATTGPVPGAAQGVRGRDGAYDARFAQLLRLLDSASGNGLGGTTEQATERLYDAVVQGTTGELTALRDPLSEASRRAGAGGQPGAFTAAGLGDAARRPLDQVEDPRAGASMTPPGRSGPRHENAGSSTGSTPHDARDHQRATPDGATRANPHAGPQASAPSPAPGAVVASVHGVRAPVTPQAQAASSVGTGAGGVTAVTAAKGAGTPGVSAASPGPAVFVGPTGAPRAGAGPSSAPTLAQQGTTRHLDVHAEAALGRVRQGLASLVQSKGGTMVMRLNPVELGEVRVQLDLNHGSVAARVEASSESARELLATGIDRLRAALEARGLKVDRIEVHGWTETGRGGERAAGGDDGGAGQDRAGRDDPRQSQGGWRPAGGDGAFAEDRGAADDDRQEADQTGTDPGAARAESGSLSAEPGTGISGKVRHGSARPLTVRLDTIV
jgi:hypothetical protein